MLMAAFRQPCKENRIDGESQAQQVWGAEGHYQLPGGLPRAALDGSVTYMWAMPSYSCKDSGGAITTEFLLTLPGLTQLPECSLSGLRCAQQGADVNSTAGAHVTLFPIC